MGLVLVTAPASEPVTLTEAKAHMRIESSFTDEDTLITSLIARARRHVETLTERSLLTTTWRLEFTGGGGFDEGGLEPCGGVVILPKPPLIAITTVTYTDANGVVQTLSSGDYRADAGVEPGRLWPAYATPWPTGRPGPAAFSITYTAGYANAAAVPGPMVQAIHELVAHWHENREGVPPTVGHLLEPWDAIRYQ